MDLSSVALEEAEIESAMWSSSLPALCDNGAGSYDEGKEESRRVLCLFVLGHRATGISRCEKEESRRV